MIKWIIIGLVGLFVICTAAVIFCVLNAADYQDDWDRYDEGEGDQIDGE